MRRSLLPFVVGSLLTLVAVGLVSVYVARDLASQAALRDAALRGGTFSRSIVTPLLSDGVVDGRVVPGSSLVSVLRSRLEDGSVRHIKLWDPTGRVVWADERALVGKTYPLEDDVLALFGTDAAIGSVTHLDKEENELEAAEGQLLEVYAGATVPGAPHLVVETYWSMERIDDATSALLRRIVPLVLGALLLFQLATFRLALSLARRVDRGLAERAVMVRHALSASELERRRIAAQLHDGVIQDLAGIGFALPSIAAGLGSSSSTRELLGETEQLIQKDVEQLRTMLTELHPGDLGDGGFAQAVEALAFRAERAGVRTHVHLPAATTLPPAAARMAYRIVREAVHNVLKHAGADSMDVTADADGTSYLVRVVDDGRGVGTAHQAEQGHLGLQLLGATLTDLGGSLSVTPGPSGGTVLEARFPMSLTETQLPERSGPTRWSRVLTRRRRKEFARSVAEDGLAPTAP